MLDMSFELSFKIGTVLQNNYFRVQPGAAFPPVRFGHVCTVETALTLQNINRPGSRHPLNITVLASHVHTSAWSSCSVVLDLRFLCGRSRQPQAPSPAKCRMLATEGRVAVHSSKRVPNLLWKAVSSDSIAFRLCNRCRSSELSDVFSFWTIKGGGAVSSNRRGDGIRPGAAPAHSVKGPGSVSLQTVDFWWQGQQTVLLMCPMISLKGNPSLTFLST